VNWPVALFDLDGTLTDPEQGIVNCIQYAFDKLGTEPPPAAALRSWIGPPLLESFLAAFDGDQESAQRGIDAYRERFANQGILENRLIPGVSEVLQWLAGRQVACYVATSKPTVYARRIVDHFGLSEHFVEVYGSDLNGRWNDKGELLEHVLECEEIDAGQAVMIGDRYHDMIGAGQNDIAALGVTWGFGSRKELIESGALAVLDRVEDLKAHWT
jgi:phosphoglycolate phosphatase